MPTDVIPGSRDTFDSTNGYLFPVEETLNVLQDRGNFQSLLKRIGIGKPVKSYKHTWYEVNRTLSKETVTIADDTTTAVTVGDTAVYKVGDILAVEGEKLRVTARTSATVLAVTRGYASTTAAAHTAVPMYNLGFSAPDGSTAPEARSMIKTPIYNYVQWFGETVEISWQALAEAQAGGNPLTQEITDATYVFWRRLFQAIVFGKRYEDTSGEKRQFGGLEYFITTNPTNAAGAVTKALINAEILQIAEGAAGKSADNLVILTSMYQAQKIDALDAALVNTTYADKTTGLNDIQTYQPGMGLPRIPIISDVSIPRDRLYILDTSKMSLRPEVNNGVSGRAALYDAKTPGAMHEKKVMWGGYTFELMGEAGHSYLYGLT